MLSNLTADLMHLKKKKLNKRNTSAVKKTGHDVFFTMQIHDSWVLHIAHGIKRSIRLKYVTLEAPDR